MRKISQNMETRAIYMTTENRRKLKDMFGVSNTILSESLHFKRNSVKNRRIRSAAVNVFGGYLF